MGSKGIEDVCGFLDASTADCRMSKSHLAIYFALLYFWQKQNYRSPIKIYSREVMPMAKVSSSGTFHALIRQLNEYGYIDYKPSYYKGKPSEVYLNAL